MQDTILKNGSSGTIVQHLRLESQARATLNPPPNFVHSQIFHL